MPVCTVPASVFFLSLMRPTVPGCGDGMESCGFGRYRRTAIPSYDVCMHASHHQSTCAKDRGDHATSIALGQTQNRKLQMSILHCLQQYVTYMRLHRKSSTNHRTGGRWRACLGFGKVPVQMRSWLRGGPPPMHVYVSQLFGIGSQK